MTNPPARPSSSNGYLDGNTPTKLLTHTPPSPASSYAAPEQLAPASPFLREILRRRSIISTAASPRRLAPLRCAKLLPPSLRSAAAPTAPMDL
jgi:hypothetical protein